MYTLRGTVRSTTNGDSRAGATLRLFVLLAIALAAVVSAPARALALDTQPVYRLCNPWTGEHLLTADKGEYDVLDAAGWEGEGEKFEVPALGGVPIYRLYNPNNSDHHYTTDANEYETLQRSGWQGEGVKLYGLEPDSLRAEPIYRLWNSAQTADGGLGSHLWTADRNEYDSLPPQSGGAWRQEDVAFCAVGPEVERLDYDAGLVTVDATAFGIPDAEGFVSEVTVPKAEGTGIRVGQTVAVPGDAENPAGTALVVTSIAETPAGYVVRGSKPEVDDLVESIQIAGTASRMEDAVTAQGVELVSDGTDGTAVTLSVGAEALGGDVVAMDTGSWSPGSLEGEPVKGLKVSVTPSFDYEYDYSWFTLHSARLTANLDARVEAEVSVKKDATIPLLDAYFPINTALGIQAKFSLVAGASGKAEVHMEANYAGGFQYREGSGVQPVFNRDLDWGASLSGKMNVGVRPAATLKLLGVASLAYVDLEGGIEVDGETDVRSSGMVCCDASAFFYLTASIDNEWNLVGEGVKLLGQQTNFELVGKGSGGNLFDIHCEDGKFVRKCTWKEPKPDPTPTPKPEPTPRPDPKPDSPNTPVDPGDVTNFSGAFEYGAADTKYLDPQTGIISDDIEFLSNVTYTVADLNHNIVQQGPLNKCTGINEEHHLKGATIIRLPEGDYWLWTECPGYRSGGTRIHVDPNDPNAAFSIIDFMVHL